MDFILKAIVSSWRLFIATVVLIVVASGLYLFGGTDDVYEYNAIVEAGQIVQFVKVESVVEMRTRSLLPARSLGEMIRGSYGKTLQYRGVKVNVPRNENRYITISMRSKSLEQAKALIDSLIKEIQGSFEVQVKSALSSLNDQKEKLQKQLSLLDEHLKSSQKESINVVATRQQSQTLLSKVQLALETPLVRNVNITNSFPTAEGPVGPRRKLLLVLSMFLGIFMATILCVIKREFALAR